jgi:hypothetical protein
MEKDNFSRIAQYIPIEEAGLSGANQTKVWLEAVRKCLYVANYTGCMKGQGIHFEVEHKRMAKRLEKILQNLAA